MKRLFLVLALAGCGGPLADLHLASRAESRRRALVIFTLPSLDRTAAAMRAWRERTSPHELVLGLFGLDASAIAAVASERPIGIAIVRTDGPVPRGTVPELPNAIAFTVRDPDGAAHWLGSYGRIVHHHGDLYCVEKETGQRPRHPMIVGGKVWAWAHGPEVILSGTPLGLSMAGPAARDVAVPADADVSIQIFPRMWSHDLHEAIVRAVAGATALLARGRATPADRAAGELAAARAHFYLRPFDEAERAEVTLKVGPTGAEARLRTTPIAGVAAPSPLTPVLDLAVVGDGPVAALGALDCRSWLFARARTFIAIWKAAAVADAGSLAQLVDAEKDALDGTCSFSVHTDDELWNAAASYPLRPGADPRALNDALVKAIRSGALPSLESAADDVTTARLLFGKRDDGVLALDRVLGATESAETRHAAAVNGGATLHDRFVARSDRLMLVSGAQADERLAKILTTLAGAGAALPPELSRALASGRGKAGFLFLDLAALWRPFLKAGQVTESPVAALVARQPTLIQHRRPLVATLEPAPGLDATATLPPETVQFLVEAAALLLTN